jgi:hypothetical protein
MARRETQKRAGAGTKRSAAGKGKTTAAKPSRGAGMGEGRPAEVAVAEGPGPSLSHEQIAERAREIWEQRGCPYGQDREIWLEAEEQLKHELAVG